MRHLLAALMLMASAPFFCQDDCDLFNIQDLAADYLSFGVDTVILQSDGSYEVQLSNGMTALITFGCTDIGYFEYDASANADDGSCASLIVPGCTNPTYVEFDPAANTDDGSCVTLIVEGCTDSDYAEFNPSANADDGSCTTVIVNGCTDPAYTEFDASATTDDGSCVTLVVEGCTDAADANYDPAANTDDGSCASNSCSSIEFDDYTYSVVEIGDQCWFAENLRTTVYADDSDIPGVTGNAAWAGLSTGARCDYDNDANNEATYGRLYNWPAVSIGGGLCPSGWHVPTDGEWTELEDYLGANGHSGAEGTALKSTLGWNSGGNGTDDFGFSALPGGYRNNSGYFFSAGNSGVWWSSSPGGGNAWYRGLNNSLPDLDRYYSNPRSGFSVRCLRDAD